MRYFSLAIPDAHTYKILPQLPNMTSPPVCYLFAKWYVIILRHGGNVQNEILSMPEMESRF